MKCPKCKKPDLIILEFDEIEVDYCVECKGIWFDSGELELLAGNDTIKKLLSNAQTASSIKTKERKRKCPICRKRMTKSILPDANGLLIDLCKNGHGFWLDDGELQQILSAGGTNTENPVLKQLAEMFKHNNEQNKNIA